MGLTNAGVLPGTTYGNIFAFPLSGGSGGGGAAGGNGGGGGGAILIAASGQIQFTTPAGAIIANGGNGNGGSGAGSGGTIRLVASRIIGPGGLQATSYYGGGNGRIRFDTLENNFSGSILGQFTEGYQPIILPASGQGAQLTVTSVGGVAVSASPSGQLATPDAVISAQQNNPIPIVVQCSNIPLNTQITVSVKPANGAAVSATGLNNTGTLSSSTATVSIVMPRGGGLIYATAATGN